MIKLSQINLVDNDMLVKGFEPIVATHVGNVAKTDERIEADKANVTHIIAEIVKLGVQPIADASTIATPIYEVGMHVLVPRHSCSPCSVLIEDFKEKELAFVGMYAVVAIIEQEAEIPLMASL